MALPESRRRPGRWHAALLLCLASAAAGRASAQDAADATAPPLPPAYRVLPRLQLSETFTDNVNLSPSNRRADQITEISPGIRISRDSGPVRGYFDYALRAMAYAQNGRGDNYLQALGSAIEVEAVDQWLFVDFSGHIAQQSLDGFGPLPGLVTSATPNTAEFSTWQLAPFVRGQLGDLASYLGRVSRTLTHSDSALASDVGETRTSLDLAGGTGFARLGWVADASRYSVDYSAGRATEADQADLGLSWAFTPQLSGVAKGGREYSNYAGSAKTAFVTSDASLSWQPTPQAQATASWGQRSFGDIHAFELSYNTPVLLLRLADRRDVAAVPGQVLPVLLIPVQGPPVITSFVTTAVSVQDRRDLSLSLLGRRDTVTLALAQSEVSRLDTLLEGRIHLPAAPLRQSGLSLDWQHRLTPRYRFEAQALLQLTEAQAKQADNLLRALSLNLQGQLWRQGQCSIGLRHMLATGASPYEETALTLGLLIGF